MEDFHRAHQVKRLDTRKDQEHDATTPTLLAHPTDFSARSAMAAMTYLGQILPSPQRTARPHIRCGKCRSR
jgi:hypothetical protein